MSHTRAIQCISLPVPGSCSAGPSVQVGVRACVTVRHAARGSVETRADQQQSRHRDRKALKCVDAPPEPRLAASLLQFPMERADRRPFPLPPVGEDGHTKLPHHQSAPAGGAAFPLAMEDPLFTRNRTSSGTGTMSEAVRTTREAPAIAVDGNGRFFLKDRPRLFLGGRGRRAHRTGCRRTDPGTARRWSQRL